MEKQFPLLQRGARGYKIGRAETEFWRNKSRSTWVHQDRLLVCFFKHKG